MSQAAELDPAKYFILVNYLMKRNDDDKTARYIVKGTLEDPDRVRASYYASWLIKYYLKKGWIEDARKEADFAGDVYSSVGLLAKAEFFESVRDYTNAYTWYANNEERYGDSSSLINFCLRYKVLTGDARFDDQVHARIGKIFPNGIEKIRPDDLKSPPQDGVVVESESDLSRAAGIKQNNVIVAIDGVRVHDCRQYDYERALSNDPELDLMVWQGDGYHEIKASPPHHLFGVDLGNYPRSK
jgi:hypothetical protein